MEKNLQTTQKIQNKIFWRDVFEPDIEQNYFIFLGNHPTLFQEFIDSGHLTIAEMNYINEHFFDYNVDPRTFENEFKRAMRESLPRYNHLKSIELIDDIFTLTEDSYTREIVSQRAGHLAQNGQNTNNGTTNTQNDIKDAKRELPMASTGSNFENTVNWSDGASNIQENKTTGSSTINSTDISALVSDSTDNGNTLEKYKRDGDPVTHIDRIWNYLIKPKAIEYLTSELSKAFILVY